MKSEDVYTKKSWVNPGVFEVAPGIFRIPLPLEWDSLGAINVYAVVHGGEGHSRIALIDSGWGQIEATPLALSQALEDIGFSISHIDQCYITHMHSDHFTYALDLRNKFGSRIFLGENERPNLDEAMRGNGSRSGLESRIVRSGSSDPILEYFKPHKSGHVWEYPNTWLTHGQEVSLDESDDLKLRVSATPGHTRGHVIYTIEERSITFSGDHVLPTITPSIGFEPMPSESPLADYLDSLSTLLTFPDALLLPGHGHVAASVHGRVIELLAHHEERLHNSLIMMNVPSTAFEIAELLPWTKQSRKFSELGSLDQLLATNETLAHLDVLVERGLAKKSERSQLSIYEST